MSHRMGCIEIFSSSSLMNIKNTHGRPKELPLSAFFLYCYIACLHGYYDAIISYKFSRSRLHVIYIY